MSDQATQTNERDGSDGVHAICGGCGHGADVHGVVTGCMGLGAANACCSCRRTAADFFGRVGIMPEPVAQDLLRQVEAMDRVQLPLTGKLHVGEYDSATGVAKVDGVPLPDRCLHGLRLGDHCPDCESVIKAAADAVEKARDNAARPRWPLPAVADVDRSRREKAAAELNAEVERARKTASAAAQKIGERHSAEWTALVARCLVGVHDAKTTARLMHAFAEAISLSARQGCELVLSAHDVLEGELAKLVASPGAATRPPTATAGEVKMDALMSGDPTTICRALWRGEAADDGAHAIAALSEWVHGHVGSGELEDRFAELLSELLLVLGGPRSAAA